MATSCLLFGAVWRSALRGIAGVAALLLAGAPAAWATEPLHDRIWYHNRAGIVYQPGKGAIALPPSDRRRELAIAESCSAVGGPRGVYKYINGKIWLVGLHRCRGAIPLHQVYPGMLTPPVAHWINGDLVAKVGNILCTSASGALVFENEVSFTVDKGSVTSVVEKIHGAQSCASKSP